MAPEVVSLPTADERKRMEQQGKPAVEQVYTEKVRGAGAPQGGAGRAVSHAGASRRPLRASALLSTGVAPCGQGADP